MTTKLAEYLTLRIVEGALLELLDPTEIKSLESAFKSRDTEKIDSILVELDPEKLDSVVIRKTESVIIDAFREILPNYPKENLENLSKNIQQFKNKGILKDISSRSTLEALTDIAGVDTKGS